jgi:hypothetical protein
MNDTSIAVSFTYKAEISTQGKLRVTGVRFMVVSSSEM